MTELLHNVGRRRRGTFVVAGVAIGAVGVVAAAAIAGAVQAGPPAIDNALPTHTFVTMTPNIPIASDAPYEASTPTHTFVQTETTEFTETTTTSEATTTVPTATAPADAPTEQDAPSASDPVYTLDITSAQVNCDGTIQVQYATTANPAPAGAANHIVMYNPTGSPTAITVVETTDNAPNGSFGFNGPGAPDLTYRVFVIGLFDPANPDGPKVIDQADVAVVDGC